MQIRTLFLGPLPPHHGGVSISLSQILRGLARTGHEIRAISPITTEALQKGDAFATRHPELHVSRYWLPKFHVTPYVSQPPDVVKSERLQVRRLAHELNRNFQPNLLIAGRESYGLLAQELAEELGLPWAIFLRGSPTAQILSNAFPEKEGAGYLDLYRSADLVISVAQYMASGLEKRFGIRGIRTIPNAAELDVFRPMAPSRALRREFSIPEGHRAVLLPGVLISRKRPMDFLRAAARVLERSPNVTFVVAGHGEQGEELREFCRTQPLLESVRWLGPVSYERMPELYNSVDLVVMTSEAEGISRVYVEALACGRPLLASDIPAARELIADGHNGFLFRLSDHRHLAERILSLLGDEERLETTSANARASVAERTIDQAVRRYDEELSAFLASSRKHPAGS